MPLRATFIRSEGLQGGQAGRFTRDRQHGCIAPPLKTFSESARGEQNFFVEPCTVLDAFSFEYRFGNTVYRVDMHRSASNAKERHGACVELVDDGKVHNLSLEYR